MTDPYEPRNRFGLAFVVLVAVLAALAFVVMQRAGRTGGPAAEVPPEPAPVQEPGVTPEDPDGPPGEDPPAVAVPGEEPALRETAEDILATLGVGVASADPEALVRRIGEKLEAGQLEEAARLIGRDALSRPQLERLRKLAADARLKLNTDRPVVEVGELEINQRSRWALNLDGERRGRIYFDLDRGGDGRWAVQKMVLPQPAGPGEPVPRGALVDALGITDAFLQAALRQRFNDAKSFVDTEVVSDAKLAGLCIIFEEGKYHLRAKNPLRAMFHRDTTAGFVAYVQASDGSNAAEFGVTVQRDDADSPWRVTEINLATLLADYADRVAGGDVYYTPLVRNPEGGDTLILYFGFDEAAITPRTARQLEIVTLLLETDPNKKLRISGYTDALGTDDYNRSLSSQRAVNVKRFLVDSGVNPAQIQTVARGENEPRRPNVTESGEDDPTGRRANRRTEIYLDF